MVCERYEEYITYFKEMYGKMIVMFNKMTSTLLTYLKTPH